MKKLLILVCIIFSSFTLFGVNLEVGLVISDVAMLFDLQKLVKDYFPFTYVDSSYLSEKDNKQTLNKLYKDLSKAYEAEDLAKISQIKEKIEKNEAKVIDAPIACSFKKIEATIDEDLAIKSKLESLDKIIFLFTENLQLLKRVRLYVYERETDQLSLVFNKIEEIITDEQIVFALMPYFYSEGSSLLVHPDKSLSPIDAGDEYEKSSIIYLEEDKIEKETVDLVVTGFSNSINLEVDGQVKGKLPLFIENVEVPFVLDAFVEGFDSSLIQANKSLKQVHFSLLPQELSKSIDYDESRKGFYTNFALSLGLFGLKVLSLNIDSKLLTTFVDGAIVISILDLVSSLFDYYNSSTYI